MSDPPFDPPSPGPAASAPSSSDPSSPGPAAPRPSSSIPSASPAAPAPASPSPPAGRVLGGLLLLAVGVLWLLETTDVIDLRWRVVLPAALIVVGVACMVLSAWQRTSGLVAVGAVLAVVVVVTALLPDQLSFRVGDQATRPVAIDDVRDEYSHGIGQLTIDLSSVAFAEDTTVRAGLGMGELSVRIPADVTVRVIGSSGIGEVSAFGRTNSGFGVRLDETFRGGPDGERNEGRDDADLPVLRLELSVGIGKVEVQR